MTPFLLFLYFVAVSGGTLILGSVALVFVAFLGWARKGGK